MPRHKRNLQVTTSPNNISLDVKPEPPEDLWQRLGALTKPTGFRPPNSFTVEEFAVRYMIPNRTARDRINYLVRKGVLDRHPNDIGKIRAYYTIKERV